MRYGWLSRLLLTLAAASLLGVCPSCNSSRDIPTAGIYFDVPTGMRGNALANWRVNMQNLVPPFEVEWDFGGGADPNTLSSGTEFPTSAIQVEMVNPGPGTRTYLLTARIRDGLGDIWPAQTEYTVGQPNNPPELISAEFDPETDSLTISARDADADTLTVSLDMPVILVAEPSAGSISGGEGSAVFELRAMNTSGVFNGEISYSIDDGAGGSIGGTIEIQLGGGITNPHS